MIFSREFRAFQEHIKEFSSEIFSKTRFEIKTYNHHKDYVITMNQKRTQEDKTIDSRRVE